MHLVHIHKNGGVQCDDRLHGHTHPGTARTVYEMTVALKGFGSWPRSAGLRFASLEDAGRKHAGRKYAAVVSLAWLLVFASSHAHAVKPVEDTFPQTSGQLPQSHPISYANATNAELDALGARWGYLSAPERRALLAEVRRRMAQNASGSTRVRIQATRQFGVVKRPDGTTIRVERRIIRMIPAEHGYGTGFEQRAARDGNGSGLSATPQEAERRAAELQTDQSVGGSNGQQLPRGNVLPASSSAAPLGPDPISPAD